MMDADLTPIEPSMPTPSHDEMLIDYLISNPCLWDKSNHAFRNRALKESKWKEIADRIQMTSAEAIRRYKTLCERFRRETVKQQSIPNYASNWSLFEKFASLKDFQMSELKSGRKSVSAIKIKTEERDVTDNMNGIMTAHSTAMYGSGSGYAEMDFMNDNNDTTHSDGFDTYDNAIDGRGSATGSGLCVQPTCIGGSTDLSTDTIAAFCQFVEASLKQLTEDQSDELMEDILALLFRKKKEFKNVESS